MPVPKKDSITKQQIKMIHALKNTLGMDDETYRFSLWEAFGVTSSKDLNRDQADGVISYFEREATSAGLWGLGNSEGKHSKLDGRPDYATSKQLSYIESLWSKVSRVEPESRAKALRSFLQRQAGVSDLRFLKRTDAGKVITALKAMLKQLGK